MMNRKEEIILVTLELAATNGLSNVSMAQIAEKMGIRKPSLYNHFNSKEEIIAAMYQYLREKSKEQLPLADIDYGEFIKEKAWKKHWRSQWQITAAYAPKAECLLFTRLFIQSVPSIQLLLKLWQRKQEE